MGIAEKLHGEGETKTSVHVRRACATCGEPAVYKHTYLLLNYRTNPASKGFGRDDCSWCEDIAIFTCRTCRPDAPEGYDPGGSRFECNERFAHLFLEWKNAPNPKLYAVPHNAICFFKDGNKWCCVNGDFQNLQESPAGFGDTFNEALDELRYRINVHSHAESP